MECCKSFFLINLPIFLQWDFEEENVRWNKLRGSHLLPLQQWPKKTKLLSNVPTSFLQKTLSGMQGCESFSSESLIQWKLHVHIWCRVLEGNKEKSKHWTCFLVCFIAVFIVELMSVHSILLPRIAFCLFSMQRFISYPFSLYCVVI